MMDNLAFNHSLAFSDEDSIAHQKIAGNLSQAEVNQDYRIRGVDAGDPEIAQFLFTLGCFEGETITLISILSESYVISIKDARYSIGSDLAQAVLI